MSAHFQFPSEEYGHMADQASTADGRAITVALLALADEVRALREVTETATTSFNRSRA